MKKILILLLCLWLIGCATMSLSKIASTNKDNLSKLSVGMSEQEVLNIMGTKRLRSGTWDFYAVVNNPYRCEIVQTQNGKTVKILYYFTDTIKSGTTWQTHSITNNELTPLVFEEGKLVGIGSDDLNSILQDRTK